MATPLAELVDTSTFDEQGRPGLTYRRITGARVALEWFVRAVLTPRDGIPWALGIGIDLASYENAALTTGQLAALRAVCDAQGMKGAIYATSVQSTMTTEPFEDGLRLTYSPRVTLARTGTFPLAVSIDKAGVILAQFPIS